MEAAFAKAGLDPDAAAPEALRDALSAGRIGDQELANWKVVQSSALLRLIATSSYVLARLLADPRLPSVLAAEVLVGSASLVLAETAARGDKFLKELDFVIANQVLIILTNVALVLALSPTAQLAAAPPAGTFGAYMTALPSYFLQRGSFDATQRAVCFFAKAAQFSVVGSCTATAGQFVTKGLVKARMALTGSAPEVQLAPVVDTAANYAAFMAGSSNTRYQLVNSFEGIWLPLLPGGPTLQTSVSVAVRTLNNYLGAASWIWWAKFRGLQ